MTLPSPSQQEALQLEMCPPRQMVVIVLQGMLTDLFCNLLEFPSDFFFCIAVAASSTQQNNRPMSVGTSFSAAPNAAKLTSEETWLGLC